MAATTTKAIVLEHIRVASPLLEHVGQLGGARYLLALALI